jgi:hypothetical protein
VDLSNKIFRLIDNLDGLASDETRMIFSGNSVPFIATYSGDNILYGNVVVTSHDDETKMLYHAVSTSNELVAGEADVHLSINKSNKLNMTLNWSWLTGDLSSGISEWVEVDT